MKTKTKDYTHLFWCIVLLASLISAVIIARTASIKTYELLKTYIIVILLIGAFETISLTSQFEFFREKRTVYDLCIGYILSSVFLCVEIMVPIYLIWGIGSIYIAKKVHPYVGIFFQLVFTFVFCSMKSYGIQEFIYNFIIGCILCILIQFTDTFLSFVYVLLIVGSVQIILNFLMNNFVFEQAISSNSLAMLLGGSFLVIIGYFIRPNKAAGQTEICSKIHKKELQSESYDNMEVPINTATEHNNAMGKIEEKAKEQEEEKTEDKIEENYARFITSDAPLMKRLNDEKPNTYRHSLLIGILSEKAAKKIGANEALAKAGGFYHEIGKLENGDYIEEGVRLAMLQELPTPLVNIIKQQNGKMEKPDTKESAIVMLTDSIITTIKYFEKQPKELRRSTDKIIDNIFKVRLEQGILEKVPLTLNEFHILKEFYFTNLPK